VGPRNGFRGQNPSPKPLALPGNRRRTVGTRLSTFATLPVKGVVGKGGERTSQLKHKRKRGKGEARPQKGPPKEESHQKWPRWGG